MAIGFKGFRAAETISDEALKAALDRLSLENLFVYWTGGSYKARAKSLRSQALRTVSEIKTAVPAAEMIRRAARMDGTSGFDPSVVRGGFFLHQIAKPCVYFALERRENGDLVAAKDIPYPDGFDRALKAGDVVVPAAEIKALARRAPKRVAAAPAPKELEMAGNKPAAGKRVAKKS